MRIQFLLLPWALAFGGVSAAPKSAPSPAPASAPHEPHAPLMPSITVPRWQSAMNDLPPAADPKPIDWRASNQTVFRLGGHVGHWRGTLMPTSAPAPAPERKP